MPGMDGLEAVQHIREAPQGQDTRIIALTATAFDEDRERIMKAGCDDFLRKPYQEAEIFNILVKHLDARFIYQELVPQPTEYNGQGEGFSASEMAELPDQLKSELRKATTAADLNHMLAVIEEISFHNALLAEQLGVLTHNFAYKQILSLIADSGDEK